MIQERSQELASGVEHHWSLFPNLRLCYIGATKIVVTPPIVFGRGYVFDGKRQVVEICRRILGIPIARSEVAFSDATSILESVHASDRFLKTARADEPPSDSVMSAIVGLFHDSKCRFYTVFDYRTSEAAATRIAAEIERLGIGIKKRVCYMEL